MKITVIGTGYVGLVSGVCFAGIGHDVVCVDTDKNKIAKLKNGQIPIYEPGLEDLLKQVYTNKRISFTTDLAKALPESDAVFIAVGTPQDETDGSADLSFIYKAAEQIALISTDYKVIVTKSTVPVGTGLKIAQIIKYANPNLEFSMASNPEFLREGAAIGDFMSPDRVVIGVNDEKAKNIMSKIYKPLSDKSTPVVYTDIATAELIKYASNSFLATKICFINEMADLCEKVGADVKSLSNAIGLDSRIGPRFLRPGPGFGGSCFPKDILALSMIAKENDSELSLVSSVIDSNNHRKERMVDKVVDACEGSVKGKTIAVLGLAFKSNTDDIRYSPAIAVIKGLLKKGAIVRSYDKEAASNAQTEIGDANITYHQDSYQAAEGSEAVVIATEWEEFSDLDLDRLKDLQKNALIIDLRNMLDGKKAKEKGFEYICIGN